MDPDEGLRQLRELLADEPDEGDDPAVMFHTASLLFGALDEWLSNGGFPPADWDHDRPARRTCDCGMGWADEPGHADHLTPTA